MIKTYQKTSKMAHLVGYILLTEKQGQQATRSGFVKFDNPNAKSRPTGTFTEAFKAGIIKKTGAKIKTRPGVIQEVITVGNYSAVELDESTKQILGIR